MGFIRTAFLDLLFNTLLLFVLLFALAFLHMRPVTHGKSIEAKAEFMLEMTWPDGSLHDIDLWLLLPDGQKVGFNRKDTGVATLDRDDRGAYGDTYWDGDRRRLIRQNREVVAVRAIRPGRYVVNVHFYGHFTEEFVGFRDEWGRPEVPVKVKLLKINPRIVDVGANEVTLFAVGQQATAFDFHVDAEGSVPSFGTDADLPFVEATK
jgi:hypothetical protein